MKNTCEQAFDILQTQHGGIFGCTGTLSFSRLVARPGQLSAGYRTITVRPCNRIRWLVVEFGWKVLAEVDQRDFHDRPAAMAIHVACVIDKAFKEYAARYTAEPGAEGKPQLIIPGAEPITQAQLLARKMEQPKRATCQQREPGGMFDDTVRNQMSLF